MDGPGHRPGVEGSHDPAGELRSLAADCVHCGFCLPHCPTYQLWGEEMDSPRGRIHLMTQVLDGAALTDATATHIDRCLGCMACVPACPSGVHYDRLIEAARAWLEDPGDRPGPPGRTPPGSPAAEVIREPVRGADADTRLRVGPDTGRGAGQQAGADTGREPSPGAATDAGRQPGPRPGEYRRDLRGRVARAAIFAVFPYPRRLRLLAGPLRAAQRTGLHQRIARSPLPGRLSPELAAALRLAPPPAGRTPALPRRVAARGRRRAVAGMLTGCVQGVFFPQVNTATARVLAAEGCDVVIPGDQGCCGALSLHSGRRQEALRLAKRLIATFERADVDAIVVNSAGCGSAMKDYALLLAGDPAWAARATAMAAKVRDFTEFLADLTASEGPAAARHPLPVTAVYHDACHLAHAQGIKAQPRALLGAIPGLELTESGDGGTCCGSAGVYNLLQPEAAAELGDRKAAAIQATGAQLLISANPGCSLQIATALAARGVSLPVAHTAQVLDASIRGLPVTALTSPRR